MQLAEPQLVEHESLIIENDHDNNEQAQEELDAAPPYDNERPPAYKTIKRKHKETQWPNDCSHKPDDKSSDSGFVYLLLAFSPIGLGVLVIGVIVKKGIEKRREKKWKEKKWKEARA